MISDTKTVNGHSHCLFEDREISTLNQNFEKLNEIHEKKDAWMQNYVEKTMPIKSHFLILIGSLSVLAGFAALIRFIEKL